MAKSDVVAAHVHTSNHRDELMQSELCGCFYCFGIYSPLEIVEWVDEDENGIGKCALCPRCGIDSVIGSTSGYPISDDFLKRMHAHWF